MRNFPSDDRYVSVIERDLNIDMGEICFGPFRETTSKFIGLQKQDALGNIIENYILRLKTPWGILYRVDGSSYDSKDKMKEDYLRYMDIFASDDKVSFVFDFPEKGLVKICKSGSNV